MQVISTDWYALDAQVALKKLDSCPQGLSRDVVSQRQAQYGPNDLETRRSRPQWQIFFAQFHNVLIYVLLAAVIVTALLGQWVDMGVILGVVLINAVIGFIQESKAETALRSIQRLLANTASVIRDGQRQTVSAVQLVPGDIVILNPGDRVPADCRLLDVHSLHTQEAILTGESQTVMKTATAVNSQTSLAERISMAYAGTLVTYGGATGIVVATGEATEMGQIGKLLHETQKVETPLLRKIQHFARWLTLGILIIAAGMFVLGLIWHDYSLTTLFIAAVAFAVAAIPEGLPPVMTITLAIGVVAMTRARAIIRHLPAVETLGSVTVVCTDKTGTLTQNEMMVSTVVTGDNHYHVTGSGYAPHGHIEKAGNEVSQVIQAAVCCNDAELYHHKDEWQLHGDPTEGALLTLGYKAGLNWQQLRAESQRLDSIPFTSEQKFMATLQRTSEKEHLVFIKGAPEQLLAMCDKQWQNAEETKLIRDYWEHMIDKLASEGLRVLAVAMKPVSSDVKNLDLEQASQGLTLLGLFGLIDTARPEARTAIAECQTAGIQVKMITGDHIATATAIAQQVGIDTAGGALMGSDLDALDDTALQSVVRCCSIFARTSPAHKLRLVKALQTQKHIVAMTGDGVNDAPALKIADMGIAMGRKGTEVAKEAADMVLTDDNFATIVKAISQGRTIYANLIKAIFYILPTSVGEAFLILLAILMGSVLPITPLQVLWINMVTAITLAVSLAFEKQEVDTMKKPPRDSQEPIFRSFLFWRVGFVALLMVAGAYGLFWWFYSSGTELAVARTVAVNAIVAYEIVYLINTRYLLQSSCSWQGWFGNPMCVLAIAIVILLQMVFTYWPVSQRLFSVDSLAGIHWLAILGFSIVLFLVVEIEKWVSRKYV